MPTTPGSVAGTNLAVVVGLLTRPPERRPLPSGDDVVALELSVRRSDGPAESVPVAWLGAPPAASAWSVGDEVLVVGRIRRRFFRAGGATQSRTEVVATTAVPTRQAAKARRTVAAALADSGLACPAP